MGSRVSRFLKLMGLAALVVGLIVLNIHLGQFEMLFHSRADASTQGVKHER